MFFIWDLKLKRNISYIKYNFKSTSFFVTKLSTVTCQQTAFKLTLSTKKKKSIDGYDLNGSVCIKLLLLTKLF